MKSSRKWRTSPINQTYLFVYLVSMTFSSQLQQMKSEKQNLARNLNFGWLHTLEAKSVLEISSIRQYIITDMSWLMLAMNLPRLSMRSRQIVGKIFFMTQWQIQTTQIQTAQICRKSSKIWTVLLMPTLQTKTVTWQTVTRQSHDSHNITDIKSKANFFINHYERLHKQVRQSQRTQHVTSRSWPQ